MLLSSLLSISNTPSENIMGTQFFWFYDLLLVAIILGFVFTCARKGFVSVVFSVLSGLIALILAYTISAPIAEAVYDTMIEEKVTEEINQNASQSVEGVFPLNTSNIKYDQITVNGKSIDSLLSELDTKEGVTLELSSVDLSKTGVTQEQLTSLGLSEELDLANVKAGTLTLSKDEWNQRQLGQWVFAKIVSSNMSNAWLQDFYQDISKTVNDIVPGIINEAPSDQADPLTKIIKTMIGVGNTDLGATLSQNVIKPVILVPIRALIILILFAIMSIAFGFLAKTFRSINKIPLIGTVNTVLGGVFGLVQAVIMLLLACILLQLAISLTGNSMIFMNTHTIDKSIVFRYIYNYEFLNLLA